MVEVCGLAQVLGYERLRKAQTIAAEKRRELKAQIEGLRAGMPDPEALAAEVERLVLSAGGRRLYAETSSRSQYAPTRAFYERCGYILDAEMRDFYAPGDGKQVYVRELATPPSNFGQTT